MRKHYIDNIRTIAILLLLPYHTLMIWNNFGEKFYIWDGQNNILSSLIIIVSPYLIPVLFVISGISARYSLNTRNTLDFIKERIRKLFIPLVIGLIVLVPIQTLYARKFFFNYKGGFINNFKYFFTHFSDLLGYDGMFTLGHLWFLLYLFIISLLALLIIKKIPFNKVKTKINKLNLLEILLLFILIFIFQYIGNFGGKSLGKYLLLYLFGYYLFTDELIEKLLTHKRLIIFLFSISQTLLIILYYKYNYYGDLLVNFVGYLGVLSSITLGKLLLDKENKITSYFKKASFPIYLLHQTILVVIAYYILKLFKNTSLQVCLIIILSFIITILFYEVIRRIFVSIKKSQIK